MSSSFQLSSPGSPLLPTVWVGEAAAACRRDSPFYPKTSSVAFVLLSVRLLSSMALGRSFMPYKIPCVEIQYFELDSAVSSSLSPAGSSVLPRPRCGGRGCPSSGERAQTAGWSQPLCCGLVLLPISLEMRGSGLPEGGGNAVLTPARPGTASCTEDGHGVSQFCLLRWWQERGLWSELAACAADPGSEPLGLPLERVPRQGCSQSSACFLRATLEAQAGQSPLPSLPHPESHLIS